MTRPLSTLVALARLLAIAPVLTLAPAEVGAFEVLGQWPTSVVSFRINPNFPDTALSGDRDTQIELLRCAADSWRNQSSTNFRFNYVGTSSRSGFNINDGTNNVSWSNQDGNGALAATLLGGFGSTIDAFDVVYFARTEGVATQWNGPMDPGSGTFDILGVGVHELGHALGLDHTPVQTATMFASAFGRGLPARTLHVDDRDGVESLYGERTGVSFAPRIDLVTPDFGPVSGGNEVVITGRNFTWTTDTRLEIGGTALSQSLFVVGSCGRIVIRAMPSRAAGPVSIRVQNELGTHVLPNAYTYGGTARPILLEVDPMEGPVFGGTPITVRGEFLLASASVRVGDVPLEDQVFVNAQTIRGTVPPSATGGAVNVTLAQGSDTAVLPAAFTYRSKVLRIGDATAGRGETGAILRVLATTDVELIGLSLGLRVNPLRLGIEAIVVDGTAATDAAFAVANVDNAAGVTTFGLVMSFTETFPTIPAGTDVYVASILCSVSPSATVGESLELKLESGVGEPPIVVLFTPADDPIAVQPFTLDGTIMVTEGRAFVRGDANANQIVDLSDPIFALNYLFRGEDTPTCLDAADSNDDGRVDISDAVFELLFLFLGGEILPPPYPQPGIDPTADGLQCGPRS